MAGADLGSRKRGGGTTARKGDTDSKTYGKLTCTCVSPPHLGSANAYWYISSWYCFLQVLPTSQSCRTWTKWAFPPTQSFSSIPIFHDYFEESAQLIVRSHHLNNTKWTLFLLSILLFQTLNMHQNITSQVRFPIYNCFQLNFIKYFNCLLNINTYVNSLHSKSVIRLAINSLWTLFRV